MGDIIVHGLSLPGTVRGVTIEQQDDFIVFINSNLSPDVQQDALQHELTHIRADHFYFDDPVAFDEQEANA